MIFDDTLLAQIVLMDSEEPYSGPSSSSFTHKSDEQQGWPGRPCDMPSTKYVGTAHIIPILFDNMSPLEHAGKLCKLQM